MVIVGVLYVGVHDVEVSYVEVSYVGGGRYVEGDVMSRGRYDNMQFMYTSQLRITYVCVDVVCVLMPCVPAG